MILLLTIIFITILQITAYILLDKYGLKNWKYLVLGLVLLTELFMPPGFFTERKPEEIVKCGMQELSVKMFFMVFGIIIAFVTHFTYVIIKKYTAKNNTQ
ncbi:hypothetical protein [Elizabethkingia meningoseptica]|uniref:hypothetical protein n=1 Tax=Elizabethkingia meningoseptica TaxID=238 RepID=UPI0038927AEA